MNKKKSAQVTKDQKNPELEMKKLKEIIASNKEMSEKIEELQAELIEKESQYTYNQNVYEKKLSERNIKINNLEKNIEHIKREADSKFQLYKEEMIKKVDQAIKSNQKDLSVFQTKIEELKEKKDKVKKKKKKYKEEYKEVEAKYKELQSKYEIKVDDDKNRYAQYERNPDKPVVSLFDKFYNELTSKLKLGTEQIELVSTLIAQYMPKFGEYDSILKLSSKSKELLKQKSDTINEYCNLNLEYKEMNTKKDEEIQILTEEQRDLMNENKKMKQLARKILQQRNDTETFFIEALDEVKKELYYRRKESEKRGNFFPTLKKFYDTDDEHVDIKNLEPETKEKIIRKLFEKINQSYDSQNYREIHDIISVDI